MVTTGAVVSIVQVELALPVLPAGSVAVTVNVWLSAPRPVYEVAVWQESTRVASRSHWKLLPVLELEKLKLAEVWLVGLAGCRSEERRVGKECSVRVSLAL